MSKIQRKYEMLVNVVSRCPRRLLRYLNRIFAIAGVDIHFGSTSDEMRPNN